MILARSVAFTQKNYDKIVTTQNKMKENKDDNYSFDDAVNHIIEEYGAKSGLSKK